MPDKRRHVLAIDSGVGGLGVVAELRRALPDVAVTYIADNAFFPYGARDGTALIERLVELLGQAITSWAPDLVVIACNTASTIALPALRDRFALPFVGTVPPVKWAASISVTRVIGLLATEATVGRDYVRDLQQRFAPDCRLIAHGARGLADLAEDDFVARPVTHDAISRELDGLFGREGGEMIDVVCLGCTHYGLLLPSLKKAGPAHVTWLDPAAAVARRAADLLATVPGRAARDRLLTTAPVAAKHAFEAGAARFGFAEIGRLAGVCALG